MIENIKWDLLQPEDIEVRIGNKIKDTDNVNLLLYQDSRCTARNLDKQFGAFGWQIDYKVVGEQIYGTLSIWDDTKQMWVSKSDTGDKSNISEDKGQSSDILKRCAVRWGFGVELYSSPKIIVPNDGFNCSGYKVSEIGYNDNREITHLVIVNRFNKEIYRWDKGATPQVVQNTPKTPSKSNLELLTEFCRQVKTEENINIVELTKFYNHYAGKINAGEFKGNIQPSKLWEKWGGGRYNANITVPC